MTPVSELVVGHFTFTALVPAGHETRLESLHCNQDDNYFFTIFFLCLPALGLALPANLSFAESLLHASSPAQSWHRLIEALK